MSLSSAVQLGWVETMHIYLHCTDIICASWTSWCSAFPSYVAYWCFNLRSTWPVAQFCDGILHLYLLCCMELNFQAILPYSQALQKLAPHIQQVCSIYNYCLQTFSSPSIPQTKTLQLTINAIMNKLLLVFCWSCNSCCVDTNGLARIFIIQRYAACWS